VLSAPALLTVNSTLPGWVVAWGSGYEYTEGYFIEQKAVPFPAQSGVAAIAAGF
jgi:hypothetical protein